MKIKIYYDHIKFRFRQTKSIKKFIEKVIREEKRIPGDLNFIFTGDERITEINKSFLNHDYNTDVISFDNNRGKEINGDIYISIDSVRDNSKTYHVRLREELIRVMIHGILHLCGYEDDRIEKKEEMFLKQENFVKDFFRGR